MQFSLQDYRNLLQEQLDIADAMLENFSKLAEMAVAFEGAGTPVAQFSSGPSLSAHPHAVPSVRKQPRIRGVLAAVREIVEDLSGPFDKNDVMALLKEKDSDLAANVSPSNLRNTLRILARKGHIKVQLDATSKTCATYVSRRAVA